MAPEVFFLVFLSVCVSSIQAINDVSLSLDLIHRDSPKSPLYNPFDTHHHRMNKAVRRSISRITRFKTSSKPVSQDQPDIIPDSGEYLMNISVGTPPVSFLGIVDTGSDLTWTQCKPCQNCYSQATPIFDSKRSSTYRDLSCASKPCKTLDGSCIHGNCVYKVTYADNSFSEGNLATETLTMKSISFPSFVFGCGHSNQINFGDERENNIDGGIIGLGVTSVSLISQMRSKINGKFSYCLVPFEMTTSSSKLNFGRQGIVSGKGVVSTPLITDIYYRLTLESITVGGNKLAYSNLPKTNANRNRGNIIIDSGTTLTFLDDRSYNQVEAALRRVINHEAVKDPSGTLKLCYKASNIIDLKVPGVIFHFAGADVWLQPVNVFARVADELFCLAMLPDATAIFGNIAQTNFLVGYDLESRTVSFKQTDCSKN